MKAAVLYEKEKLLIENWDIPSIKKNEVLLEVKATGICGSDLPRFFEGNIRKSPLILGHEFAGKTVSIGEEVKRIKEGDRVAGIPLVPCKTCRDCLKGDFGLCSESSFIGTKRDGSLTEYLALPEENCIILPDDVSYQEGAMFEPSAVAGHSVKQVQTISKKNVAVIGAGNIGLLIIQWLKVSGAKSITAIDINNKKLSLAKKLGADCTINALDHDEQLNENLVRDDKDYEVVFEAAGLNQTITQSLQLVANKGEIVIVSLPNSNIHIPTSHFEKILRKELVLKGTWMSYSNPFPGDEWSLTKQFLSEGQFNFKVMIDRTFSLEDTFHAFHSFKTAGGWNGKVLILNE